MSFREWLPITRRNRVAIGFAAFSLIVFATWNCIPVSDYHGVLADRIFAVEFWPKILGIEFYAYAFASPDLVNMMGIAACMAIYIGSVATLAMIPLWKFFHATPILRIPIAVACTLGGLVVIFGMLSGRFGYGSSTKNMALALISVNMFSISAALFTFHNELALREERAFTRKGGSA